MEYLRSIVANPNTNHIAFWFLVDDHDFNEKLNECQNNNFKRLYYPPFRGNPETAHTYHFINDGGLLDCTLIHNETQNIYFIVEYGTFNKIKRRKC